MTREERKWELAKLTKEKKQEMYLATAQKIKEDVAQRKREADIKAKEDMEVKKIEEASKLRELQEKIVLEHDVIIEQETKKAIDLQETKECEQKPVRDVHPMEPCKCSLFTIYSRLHLNCPHQNTFLYELTMISLVKDWIHFPHNFFGIY